MLFKKRRTMQMFRQQWGCDPRDLPAAYMSRDRLKLTRLYYEKYGRGGTDDVTWSDLEMDEVFFRINHTRSFAGEQILYLQLHEPAEEEELSFFENLASLFGQDEEGRLLYEYRLNDLGKSDESYYLPVMLGVISDYVPNNINFYRCLQLLLVSFLAGMIVFRSALWGGLMISVVLINLMIYIVTKAKMEHMFYALYNICGILRFCRFAENTWPLSESSVLDQVRFDLELLKNTERAAGSFTAKKKRHLMIRDIYSQTTSGG